MKLVEPSVTLLPGRTYMEMVETVERISRVSTKSTGEVGESFVRARIKENHHAVLRHAFISVLIVCSRRVSHEFVRHHVGLDIVQESTRWCNYAKDRFSSELTFVIPKCVVDDVQTSILFQLIEDVYISLSSSGLGPDATGYILPNALKTELGVTANIEAWRNLLVKRSSPKVLPEFRHIVSLLTVMFKANFPVFFEDLGKKEDA